MQIIGLVAENYKRLRVVEITPKGRVIQITGKNGQGKTSVLDAIWAALVGAKAMPDKPVRKGADRARIKLDLGELVVTRTIAPGGTHTLTVENAKGTKIASPQGMLDELLGALTIDPLAFVQMKPKEQIEALRKVAKIDLNVEEMNAADQRDYQERTIFNRDLKRLESEVANITVQEGLPKEKIDESPILKQLTDAGDANRQVQEQFKKKQALLQAANDKVAEAQRNDREIARWKRDIEEIERHLQAARESLQLCERLAPTLGEEAMAAQTAWKNEPDAAPVDVGALTAELQQAQLVNREIDKRIRRQKVEEELRGKQREVAKLTRQMEDRAEAKRKAIASATMPIAGLAFDENTVTFNGIPLEQLGEAEQIRISTSIAMAGNPKLRIIRILNGEALDEDNLKMLADMAEANDFQIWMAKVDSSGKVGVVMEDGMVKSESE